MLAPSKKDSPILAAVSYFFGSLISLIIYLLEKEDKWLRFHALQSLLFDIAFYVVYLVLFALAFVAIFATLGIGIICIFPVFLIFPVYFILKIWWAYRAYKGDYFEVPYLAKIIKEHTEL